MKKILNKLRNPILVSSVLSSIFLILSSLDIINITDNNINLLVNYIMSILSILGILHVPQKRKSTKKNNTKRYK
jgi:uncharacterized membrane protein